MTTTREQWLNDRFRQQALSNERQQMKRLMQTWFGQLWKATESGALTLSYDRSDGMLTATINSSEPVEFRIPIEVTK